MTLVEVLIAAAVVATILVVVVNAMHVAVSAVPSTNGQVADAVHAVASDARAALAYGATVPFQTKPWVENGVTITPVLGSTTLTIVGIKGASSYQETIPLNQEAVDPNAGFINAH